MLFGHLVGGWLLVKQWGPTTAEMMVWFHWCSLVSLFRRLILSEPSLAGKDQQFFSFLCVVSCPDAPLLNFAYLVLSYNEGSAIWTTLFLRSVAAECFLKNDIPMSILLIARCTTIDSSKNLPRRKSKAEFVPEFVQYFTLKISSCRLKQVICLEKLKCVLRAGVAVHVRTRRLGWYQCPWGQGFVIGGFLWVCTSISCFCWV